MNSKVLPHTLEFTSRSLEQTLELGRAIGALSRAGDRIALIGPLGAGKTQFVRGFAAGRGADERLVSSPTFVLMCEYPAPIPVVHIDAYRINTLDELESMGWSDQVLDESITLIEWADRIGSRLPADHLRVELDHAPEGTRTIRISAAGNAWDDRWRGVQAAVERLIKARHSCPTCGKSVAGDDKTFPFCSSRCRNVDLGKWFNGEYGVSEPLRSQDQERY